MTSNQRSDKGDASPETFAASIQKIATQRPPPPEGKGIVMVILAVVVVAAALYQFLSGTGGAADAIAKNHPEPIRALEAPTTEPEGPRPERAPDRAPTAPRSPREIEVIDPTETAPVTPIVLPGGNLVVPDGIDTRTAGAIRLSLSALGPGRHATRLVIEDALRHMATVAESAPEASRAKARAFLLEQLAMHVRRTSIGGRVLDAALEVAGDDPSGLEPVVDAALNHALRSDANAPAALVFLGAIPEAARGDAAAVLTTLVRDDVRPLHVRLLALERLQAWGAVSDALRTWVSGDARPGPMRDLLK